MKITKVFRKDIGAHRWKIDITIDGRRVRRADFPTKQEAQDAIAALRTTARMRRYRMISPHPKITLGKLKEEASADRAIFNRTMQIFAQFVDIVGETTGLADLTKAHWKKYVDSLPGRKAGTVNRYMAAISGVLSSASERFPDLADWSPPKAPWLRFPPGRSRVLSREEIAKLLAALRAEKQHYEQTFSVRNRAEVFDLFRLMLLTGAREGEILSLKPSQISWDWRTVRIESEKGGGSIRVVPLSDLALEILRSRQDRGQRFFDLNRDRLYRTLRRVADLSGVAYGDNIEDGWVCYDLRHVSGTVMENAGIPYSAVAAILGHKRQDQTATYTHAQMDTLRRGIETLETWCREIDGFLGVSGQKKTSADPAQMQACG